MEAMTLSGALEQEHRAIDAGIEEWVAGLEEGRADSEPLARSLAALRRHIYLEEEFVFPPLRQAGMMAPVFVMLREHGELWRAMEHVEALLQQDADARALLDEARDLLARLDAHNTKEEPIVYPMADRILDEAATDDLKDLLHAGRTPEGWACEQA